MPMSFISYRDDKQDLFINPAKYVEILDNVDGGNNSDVVHQFLNLKTFERYILHQLVCLKRIGLLPRSWS